MTNAAIASSQSSAPRLTPRDLAHIPGTNGWPVVGNMLQILANPKTYVEHMAAAHGPVFRNHILGETTITLLGPEANELVLLDREKNFSSEQGWARVFDQLFPRGLRMRDFEEHRLHRQALAVAFQPGPMRSYLEQLNIGIAAHVAEWRKAQGGMSFHPAIKRLTLDLVANAFLGAEMGPDTESVKQALSDMIQAAVSPVRKPLPFTQMRRGVQGRAVVVDYFGRQIPLRRKSGGADLFSQLCCATLGDGALLSDQDVVEHVSFLMMAAHDTLTSALTSLVWMLAANQHWQEYLRDEVRSLGLARDEPLPFEKLGAMPATEMAFKEAVRINPPTPSLPRRALRDFEFNGIRIPAGARCNINPLYTHHMPEIWREPERFHPPRFTEEATRARHPFAWIPFGGGAHMCLGQHFALMQARCFIRHLLVNMRIGILPAYKPDWQMWPNPRPKDGLPLNTTPV